MTEEFLNPLHAETPATADVPQTAEIFRHPAARLHDEVLEIILPAIEQFSVTKRVKLEPTEFGPVARYALQHLSRKKLRAILRGEDLAVRGIQLLIDHALDVLASMRLIAIGRAINSLPPLDPEAIVFEAEELLRKRFANDKAPVMQIWADPVESTVDYVKRTLAEQSRPVPVTLPEGASIRCTIKRASRSQITGRADTLRGGNLAHE